MQHVNSFIKLHMARTLEPPRSPHSPHCCIKQDRHSLLEQYRGRKSTQTLSLGTSCPWGSWTNCQFRYAELLSHRCVAIIFKRDSRVAKLDLRLCQLACLHAALAANCRMAGGNNDSVLSLQTKMAIRWHSVSSKSMYRHTHYRSCAVRNSVTDFLSRLLRHSYFRSDHETSWSG